MREKTSLVLVHHPTLGPEGNVISSAMTSLDLHDLARLARTYGLGGVYAQTNLPRQAELVGRLLDHWVRGMGGTVNPHRSFALACLTLVGSVEEAATDAEKRFGERPLLFATSAREGADRLGFGELKRRLAVEERPALILFGTGWGLAPEVLALMDGVIAPIGTPSAYNHLSVRSAASIVVDRLFGE